MTELRRTPVVESHRNLKAKMVPFAGWEMPVEYSGILEEHAAVRNAMGLFDVSHMGEIEIRGSRALDFCQKVTTNDASLLKPGKIQYSAILNDRGGVIDDCTLYRLSEDRFLFVVNASRKDQVLAWFQKNAMDHAQIEDLSDTFGLLALQGPKSSEFLRGVVRRDLSTIHYYEFGLMDVGGVMAMVSRTGYTGEDGFEIYLPSDRTREVWDLLLSNGKDLGLKPIGLGARDTLRLEMGYMLYGNDMNEETTPLEAGLGWIVKMNKGFFHGRDVLAEQKEKGIRRRIRGFKSLSRAIPRAHYEVLWNGEAVGEVTSGTFSPTLKVGIGLGYVASHVPQDANVAIRIRNREEPAAIVKPPFVKGSVQK